MPIEEPASGPSAQALRVCLVYDCLFPYTVGGAERMYRSLAELLAADGHPVTYVTLRQWARGAEPELPGITVRAVGPRMKLYAAPGRRRVLPPIVYGIGVLWHLLRHGRNYDAVHCASFPYFSLLAAGAARILAGYRLVVDWHEVWTREYWREYLGPLGGLIGWYVQRLCMRVPQRAFCFSQLHGRRLRAEGLAGEVTVLPGEWDGRRQPITVGATEPLAVFAGRHIPEKRVPAIPPAIARARERMPDLRAIIFGDGPDRPAVLREVAELGLEDVVQVPGFVESEKVEDAIGRALCLILPSRREGYGLVVLEASARGTPSILVAGPDNAAVELVAKGENGFIAATASPEDLADAIVRVQAAGARLRDSTSAWFAQNVDRLSLQRTLETQVAAYRRGAPVAADD